MIQATLKTVKIHFAGGEVLEIKLHFIPLNKTWIEIRSVLQKSPNGFLAERKHRFLQTQFILDGTDDCVLIGFDEHGKFVSSKPFYNHKNAPFSYLISDPVVIVLPAGTRLPSDRLISMEV